MSLFTKNRKRKRLKQQKERELIDQGHKDIKESFVYLFGAMATEGIISKIEAELLKDQWR